MREKAMKPQKMKVPLFENGSVVFCTSIQEWHELHRGLKVDGGDDLTNGASRTLRHKTHGSLYIIGVFNGKHSTVAHECAHVAFDICSDVGVTVQPGCANETYCYLLSRLVEFCSKRMEKTDA
ncbi:hypothetical protein Q2T70_03835 [Klebsiella oxytoca]|uniref:hypothetical protein n=1 Tax=Klebsiella oxytoca TaxID=571 RepID=UPI00265EA5E2|nr:hypothetical protein [Klebsiella oxytoca]WKM72889.1 hypothetical protein Q2T70_03835 [Klebsiella oxytoca]